MFVGIDKGRATTVIGEAQLGGDQLAAVADAILAAAGAVGMEFEAAQAVRPLQQAVELAHNTVQLIARKIVELDEADTGFSIDQMNAAAGAVVAAATTMTAIGQLAGGTANVTEPQSKHAGLLGGGLFDGALNLGKSIVGGAAGLGDAAVDRVNDATDAVVDKAGDAWDRGVGLLGDAVDLGKRTASKAVDLGEAAVDGVTDAAGAVADAAGAVWNGVVDGTKMVYDKVTDVADMVVDAAVPFAKEAWHRVVTLQQYGAETGRRRVTNPVQSFWDMANPTILLEDLAAVEAILGEGGELYHDDADGYGGREASIIIGVSVPPGADAMTLGHTIRVAESDPTKISDALIAHEVQHVYDFETLGAAAFGATYYGEWAYRLVTPWEDGGYHELWTEKRAYEVMDGYANGVRPSHDGPHTP